MCDVNISISWIRSGRSLVVRYENLRVDPQATLSSVAESIAPASRDRIVQAIDACDIKVLRDNYAIDSRFFRRALIGEWRSVLPIHVLRRFAEEEPFRSQFSFLGYELNVDKARANPRKEKPITGRSAPEHFDNGVPFVPVLAELLESAPPEKKAGWRNVLNTASRDCFFHWASAAADDDPLGSEAIPLMTNLAVFVYKQRPDFKLHSQTYLISIASAMPPGFFAMPVIATSWIALF